MKCEVLDINFNDYRAIDAVSQSKLKRFMKAPMLANITQNETKAMIDGRIAHSLVLEPNKFKDMYVMKPKLDQRTKLGKKAYKLFEEESIGKTIITEEQMNLASHIYAAIYTYPSTASIFKSTGVAEKSIVWKDEITGLLCKCRIDYLTDEIIDLKTTTDASPKAVTRSVINFCYHIQAAFYLDGCKAAGLDIDTFKFVFVEKSFPHLVSVWKLDGIAVDEGRRQYKQALVDYARCESLSEWPGYIDEVQTLTLPDWAM